jgi:uncharacterized protein YaaR (DUF327 family)
MKVRNAPVSTEMMEAQRLFGHKLDFVSGGHSFQRDFNDRGREQYEQNIAELADKINAQGARLAKKIDIAEMERYRMLVSELLREVVCSAYVFQKENTIDARGRRKVYATIMIINQKLEEMAKDILSGNQDALFVMSSIDDIRGLIVDIFL